MDSATLFQSESLLRCKECIVPRMETNGVHSVQCTDRRRTDSRPAGDCRAELSLAPPARGCTRLVNPLLLLPLGLARRPFLI